ncbi:TolC family protein [Desulfohalovibrio reitneri]|uniref:TolC family protein n=1 Tax=Desulfohalovibrio reitneri TaxID=1307759 RepID=UPI00068FDF6F|nr:TolC family protein [Desulfohalovibrio reitneri]
MRRPPNALSIAPPRRPERSAAFFLAWITGFMLCLWALLAPPANAQEPETTAVVGNATMAAEELADLNAYLAEAAEKNPELRAAFEQWKSELENVPQVGSLPDPTFKYGYYVQPVETRTGPQRHRFGLTQSFPWFGTLSTRERQAALKADAAYARLESQRLEVYRRVKDAYYEYAYLAQAIAITGENIELLRYLEEVVTTRYQAGLSSYSEVIRLQVELGKLRDRLNSLRDLRGPVAARLNEAMNRPSSRNIPLPESIPVMITSMSDEELLEGITDNNPALDEYRALAEASDVKRELAELDYLPDFAMGVETIVQDRARQGDPINNGDNPVIATAQVKIPLWRAKRDAAVRQAKLDKSAYRRKLVGKGNSLASSMQVALYDYRDAQRRIELYRDSLVPKAEQGLGATLEAFQTGADSALDLVEAERTLLEFELAHLRALADQAQAMADMEAILGRDIPCEVHCVTVSAPEPEDMRRPGEQPGAEAE